MPQENPTKSIEGIFEVERKSKDDIHEETKSVEGKVLDVEHADLYFHSTALFSEVGERVFGGVYLKIQNERGIDKVEFPKEISLTDKKSILNQDVRYTIKKWGTLTEGTSKDYSLEILSGPLQGEKLKKNVVV